jgi:hypothetical protein
VGKARRNSARCCPAGKAVPQICVRREPSLRPASTVHLLAEDRAHRELEAIPAAGRAQAGPLGDQRRQQRVLCQMRVDRRDVGAKVEHAADAPDDGGQGAHRREADACAEARPVRQVDDLDRPHEAILQHGPAIGVGLDPLDAVDRARLQEREHRVPVVRRTVGEAHGDADLADRAFGQGMHRFPPQRAWRPLEQLLEGLVEAPHAAEPGGQRDLRHRQAGVVDQLLGEQHAPGLRHGDGRGAEMLVEQAPQLPLADAEPLGPAHRRSRRRRRAHPPRSAPGRARRCSTCRATSRDQGRSPGGSAGTDGSRLPARRPRSRRTGSSRTWPSAPGRSAGNRSRSR